MLLRRRRALQLGLLALSSACGREPCPPQVAPAPPPPPPGTREPPRPSSEPAPEPFALAEKSFAELRAMQERGELGARGMVELYLSRIAAIDRAGSELRSVIEVTPDALERASALDRERAQKGPRGPLHGLPILLKDNIATADGTETAAGSLALVGHRPSRDSFVAEQLRKAGALLLGKANLSEWANFRSRHAVSGWSSRGGQCKNPYAPARNPCGSSSGSAAATSANLCAGALGTETHGSILCPASACGIVGVKPTLGLVSRRGIIPIAHSFDTAGPMARTVRDAAELLGAMQGVDSEDAATAAAKEHVGRDYTAGLKEDALRGARIGVARPLFGFHPETDDRMEEALGVLEKAGAELVDPVDLSFPRTLMDDILEVMFFEVKAGLNEYLAGLGSASLKTLADVIAFNEAHADEVMPHFGQDLLIDAQKRGGLDDPRYRKALRAVRQAAREAGIDRALREQRLDAIVAPSGSPAWLTDPVLGDHFVGGSATLAAMAGYPNVTVPAGMVGGLPVGMSIFGAAFREPELLGYAFAFEQARGGRVAPGSAILTPPTQRPEGDGSCTHSRSATSP